MKTIIKAVEILLVLLLLLSIIGCSIPNPSKPGDTLLVGRLSLEASGYPQYNGYNLNGSQVDGVFLYLQNCDNHKLYTISTDHHGLFMQFNPKPGTYIIKELSYDQKEHAGFSVATMSLTWKPNIELARFQIVPGQVINLGSLHWVADKANKVYQLTQDVYSTDELNLDFTKNYPNSPWLKREWVSPPVNCPDNENPPVYDYRALTTPATNGSN